MTETPRRATILFVDDEKAVREYGERALLRLGYSVLVADNGRTAVELYRQRPGAIALVILDLMMPVMDGTTAFWELRAINPEVKVLFTTGSCGATLREAALDQGGLGVLDKPFKPHELGAELQRALAL